MITPSPALAAGLAMVARLARQAPIAAIKRGAKDALQLGAQHGECRVRYGERVRALAARGLTLEQAAAALIDMREDFRECARYSQIMWSKPGPVLSIQIISEMAIVARWLRRYQPMRWPEIIEAMGGAQHALPDPVHIVAAE